MNRASLIRAATVQDAEAIARLSETLGYVGETESTRARLDHIRRSDSDLILVAENEAGSIVGWLQAHAACIIESGFRVEITGLVIAVDARRRGTGRTLVAEAERWARSISAEAIVVRSNVQRTESHAFYPALGYVQAKTQAVYRKTLTKAKGP
jgi:predicted N-acetyltransferase YhbS